jgi:3-phosphoshikimate 1-carboxyvinyltransferase
VEVLRAMGAEVEVEEGAVRVRGPRGPLRGGSFNLSDCPDLLPVVAVLGLRCEGGVEVRGVAHARYKETDRLSALAEELSKLGASVSLYDDGLRVEGGELKGCTLDPRGDHRLFMAFCLAGLVAQGGCEVLGAESAYVSYPTFIEDMRRLGASLEVE